LNIVEGRQAVPKVFVVKVFFYLLDLIHSENEQLILNLFENGLLELRSGKKVNL